MLSRPDLPRKPSVTMTDKRSPSTEGVAVITSGSGSSSPRKPSSDRTVPAVVPKLASPSDSSPAFEDGVLPLPSIATPKKPVMCASEYATVDDIEDTVSSNTAPMYNSATAAAANNGGYEYADPNALGKWSLQDIARGVTPYKPSSGTYATVDGEYSEVQYSGSQAVIATNKKEPDRRGGLNTSDSEDDDYDNPPPVPIKNLGALAAAEAATPAHSAVQQTSKLDRLINMIQPKKPVDFSSFASNGEPVKVFVRGLDISFPNRVQPPRHGARPCRMLTSAVAK
jgi:hypothetical protein